MFSSKRNSQWAMISGSTCGSTAQRSARIREPPAASTASTVPKSSESTTSAPSLVSMPMDEMPIASAPAKAPRPTMGTK